MLNHWARPAGQGSTCIETASADLEHGHYFRLHVYRESCGRCALRSGWWQGWGMIPTPHGESSSLLRSQQKDHSCQNPAAFINFLSWVCTHHAPFAHLMKQGSFSYFLLGPTYCPSKSAYLSPGTQPMLSPKLTLTSVLTSSFTGGSPLLLILHTLHVPTASFWKPP